MKILFSFECNIIPIRASTLTNWLVSRGHTVDLLYEDTVCGELIKGAHFLKNATIYKCIYVHVPKTGGHSIMDAFGMNWDLSYV